MTTTTARPTEAAPGPGNASVVRSMPGLPWFGAVLLTLVLTIIGLAISGNDFPDGAPPALWVCFLAGCVLAVLAVRRHAVFTAMVQPPLVLAVVVLIGGKFVANVDWLIAGVNLVRTFPMMCVGTGLAIVLGLLRIVIEPSAARRAR